MTLFDFRRRDGSLVAAAAVYLVPGKAYLFLWRGNRGRVRSWRLPTFSRRDTMKLANVIAQAEQP